ncbi:MAG: CCA tRNA nucleotidyltransferase [Pseudolabrys sp.]
MMAAPSLAGAAWLNTGALARLLGALDRDGEEARAVGGAVRNALLGMKVGEIDLATTAAPEEVARRVEAAGMKAVPTGIEHGTVTVVADGAPFEVTTLRRDIETYGRHAKVAFGRDWKADAQRRDFTINALSASRDGTVHDYTGGLDDLAARKVRFIGDAKTRIEEDYLRILRFFRFHAGYGEGALDADGLAACIALRAGLEQLSRERIRMEFIKLLVAERAAPVLQTMADAGLLLIALNCVPNVTHFSAMAALERALSLPADPMRRLGALAMMIVEDAERLSEKLRLSNAESAKLISMLENWRTLNPQNDGREILYRRGAERFIDRVLFAWARSGAPADDAPWRDLATLPQRWNAPDFPVKAADLMARGLAKGPALGAALKAAEAAWIAAGFPSGKSALDKITDDAADNAKQ